jgi:hypothetical protein
MAVSQRAETIRRIQIAAIGLISVIGIGGMARMADSVASEETPVEEEIANSPAAKSAEEKLQQVIENKDAADPLAELGVTPAVADPAQNGAGKAPSK